MPPLRIWLIAATASLVIACPAAAQRGPNGGGGGDGPGQAQAGGQRDGQNRPGRRGDDRGGGGRGNGRAPMPALFDIDPNLHDMATGEWAEEPVTGFGNEAFWSGEELPALAPEIRLADAGTIRPLVSPRR